MLIEDLATELNMSSVDLIRLFERLGLGALNPSSAVQPHIAEQLRTQLSAGSAGSGSVVPRHYDTAGERITREHQARRAAGEVIDYTKQGGPTEVYEPIAARMLGNSIGGSENAGHAPLAEMPWQFEEASPEVEHALYKLPRQNYADDDG